MLDTSPNCREILKRKEKEKYENAEGPSHR